MKNEEWKVKMGYSYRFYFLTINSISVLMFFCSYVKKHHVLMSKK